MRIGSSPVELWDDDFTLARRASREKGRTVGIRNFIVGLAGNFIVSGVIAYLTSSTKAGEISFGVGLLLLLIAVFIRKKPEPHAQFAPINQENKQEFKPHAEVNPQITVSPQITVGGPTVPG